MYKYERQLHTVQCVPKEAEDGLSTCPLRRDTIFETVPTDGENE